MKSYFLLIFLVISWVSAQSEAPTGEPPGTVDPNQPLNADASPRCKQYEHYVLCGPWCEPSCENPEPKNCIKRCFTGCQCINGYYRNKSGYCVKWSDCPQPLTCRNIKCLKGYVCRMIEGKPRCIWEPPGCEALRCTTPGGCALVYPLSCFLGFCKPQPTCVSYNACYSKTCPAGQVCILRQVVCVRTPCYHVADCIPEPH